MNESDMAAFMEDEEKRVLVIDDDEGDCCLVEDILSEDGIRVVKAVGGERGIRLLAEKDFPVVITDLRMPDIDGLAVIDFIRKRRMESIIIVITGFASLDSVIEALRSGAYDYILKPFSPDLLKLTVQRAFDYISMRDEKEQLKFFEMVTQLASTSRTRCFSRYRDHGRGQGDLLAIPTMPRHGRWRSTFSKRRARSATSSAGWTTSTSTRSRPFRAATPSSTS